MAGNFTVGADQSATVAFTQANQKATILATVLVLPPSGDNAIESTFARSQLVNSGALLGEESGVEFESTSTNSSVLNTAKGIIVGDASNGVALFGRASSLVNHGVIVSYAAVAGAVNADGHGSLVNTGTMVGKIAGAGVIFSAEGGSANFNNAGSIRGFAGVLVNGMGPSIGVVTATNNGTIKGQEGAAFLVDGNARLTLTNHGTLLGGIFDVADLRTVVNNSGGITSEVHLGGGNDLFRNVGNGRSGHVFGEEGVDRLTGGNRADWLDGGLGRDFLTGKGAADRFHFSDDDDTPPGGLRDVIVDFSRGQRDRIDVSDIGASTYAFRGQQAFAGGLLPSIRYTIQNPAGTGNDKTIVYGDFDGNATTDFQIELRGIHHLVAGDFVL